MIDQIRDAVERAAADEGVVAIIITGTGRAFSRGLDAGDLARSTERVAPPSARDTAPDELPALFSHYQRKRLARSSGLGTSNTTSLDSQVIATRLPPIDFDYSS